LEEVGGDDGVGAQPRRFGPACGVRTPVEAFDVVDDLASPLVGEPVDPGPLVLGVKLGGIEPERLASLCQCDRLERAGAAGELAVVGDRDIALAGAPPGRHATGCEPRGVEVFDLGLTGGEAADGPVTEADVDPLAEGAELEGVEQPAGGLDGPALPGEAVDVHGELQVADEAVEPVVAQDVVEVVAQVLAGLAADLVKLLDQS